MRILHAYKIYRPDIEGGIPAVISSLTRDHTHSHAVLAARRLGFGKRYRVDNIPVQAVTSFGTAFSTPVAPTYIPAFSRSARAADIVIHHAPFPLTDLAVLLALPRHVALIVFWHADILGFPFLKTLVTPPIRRILARADAILVSGQSMIQGVDLLAPHAGKCEVVPFGIDFSYWQSVDAEERSRIEAVKQKSPRHILAIGRLVGYKGFDVLVRAMRDIAAELTIVGEGPLLAELRQLASDLGVAGRIHFPGRIDRRDIKVLLHAAQALAFPSVTAAEAFGIVQIEAMAAGLPIVNTNLPTAVPEVARHDQEALTVSPQDPVALAQALNRILDEPGLAARLSVAARDRVSREFDERVFHTRMNSIYAKVSRTRAQAAALPRA